MNNNMCTPIKKKRKRKKERDVTLNWYEISFHCSSVGSTPVGLWAQAWSKKKEPFGAFCDQKKKTKKKRTKNLIMFPHKTNKQTNCIPGYKSDLYLYVIHQSSKVQTPRFWMIIMECSLRDMGISPDVVMTARISQ